jgi:hypothetical protein
MVGFCRSRTAARIASALGYLLVACALKWPLPLHLKTHLLGDPAGDTGVYVWNLWIFHHELLGHGHLPFSTEHIFAYSGGADFSLHNYAPVAGALGAPFVGALGVVGAFNVVLIALAALSAMAMSLLARRLGFGRGVAWTVGALFIASPTLTARDAVQFSLTITAALPLFLWSLLQTLDGRRTADAGVVGVSVALASYSDAYFGIFCGLMGAFIVAWRFTRLEWREGERWRYGVRVLDIVIVALAMLIVWRLLHGPATITVGRVAIGLNTLYTPALLLLVSASARAWFAWRPVPILESPPNGWRALIWLALVAISTCLALLLPALIGIGVRLATGRMPSPGFSWRSTPRGVDLLSYLVPNQNHPWFGERTHYWSMPPGGDSFPEYVASFSLIASLVIAIGATRRALPRMWVGFTLFFVLLSLGPFIHVAGVNTYVLAPWGLLRFVPVIGMVRSPGRFAIVAVLGMSLLFGFALEALLRGAAHWRNAGARALAVAVGVALAVELTPVPRQLYSAAIPDVYGMVAAAGDESGRLLELPTGIRDGTSSIGSFSASTQFYQTRHHRPVIGGYLSRVSKWRKRRNQRIPMLRALFTLSEGKPLREEVRQRAMQSRDAFLRASCVSVVVVHRNRAPADLEQFAVQALRLKLVYGDSGYRVYTPIDPPPCERPARGARPGTP